MHRPILGDKNSHKSTAFLPKMQVFARKIQKNLRISKKSSIFAPAFEETI